MKNDKIEKNKKRRGKMVEIKELLKVGTEQLKQANILEARRKANRILANLLGIDLVQLLTKEKEVVTKEQQDAFEDMVQRLLDGEPIQYITRKQEFMGLPFYVTKEVLIPQPDTEILVEEALQRLPDYANVLDLCTGSGCVRYFHSLSWKKYKQSNLSRY